MNTPEQQQAKLALRRLFSKPTEVVRLQRAAICRHPGGCTTLTIYGLCKRHRGESDAP
jgi:hypothetical protein